MDLTVEKGRLRTQYERMHREMEEYKQRDRVLEENKSLQTVRRILKYLKEQIGDLEYRENEIQCKFRGKSKMAIGMSSVLTHFLGLKWILDIDEFIKEANSPVKNEEVFIKSINVKQK